MYQMQEKKNKTLIIEQRWIICKETNVDSFLRAEYTHW